MSSARSVTFISDIEDESTSHNTTGHRAKHKVRTWKKISRVAAAALVAQPRGSFDNSNGDETGGTSAAAKPTRPNRSLARS